MPPLSVCFFNRSYFPDLGATGQLLTELAEGLVGEHGCQVSVVTGLPVVGQGGNQNRARSWIFGQKEIHNGVEIYRAGGTYFGHENFIGRVVNYVTYFLSGALLSFRLPRADVVVSLTDPPIIGLIALLTSWRFGAKFVFLCQDIFPEVAKLIEHFRSETLYWFLNQINCLLIRKADWVVALGAEMKDRLVVIKNADPKKVSVIHNWSDCSLLRPGPKRSDFSESNGISNNFVVMHSGNIGLSQNLESLVDAAHLLREYTDIKIVFMGEGVKKERLMSYAGELGLDNVLFLPYQPKESLTECFGAANVFVVSLMKGLAGFIVPSKLYGILAAGRPFVATVEENSEVDSVARRFKCGLISSPGDSREMANNIITFYKDPELARRMGKNARLAAMEYDRPRKIQEYHDLFMMLLFRKKAVRSFRLKRVFDVVYSGIGLVISSPLWFIIFLCIKLDDGGPVFFLQERLGKDGSIFRVLKFRSMGEDAEEDLGPVQAGESDSRVTRVGRKLRATAMDELPQLWNIFRGDMSFVGPRAIRPEESEVAGDGTVSDAAEVPGYLERQSIVPGLTGIAQIYGKHDTPRNHKFRYDILYNKKQCFWLDMKLIFLSFWITFRGKWETRDKKI